jgi:hypothetical protein
LLTVAAASAVPSPLSFGIASPHTCPLPSLSRASSSPTPTAPEDEDYLLLPRQAHQRNADIAQDRDTDLIFRDTDLMSDYSGGGDGRDYSDGGDHGRQYRDAWRRREDSDAPPPRGRRIHERDYSVPTAAGHVKIRRSRVVPTLPSMVSWGAHVAGAVMSREGAVASDCGGGGGISCGGEIKGSGSSVSGSSLSGSSLSPFPTSAISSREWLEQQERESIRSATAREVSPDWGRQGWRDWSPGEGRVR